MAPLGEVLIVDDSDPDLLYTRIVLEQAGVAQRVRPLETAAEALAWLQAPEGQAVDAVLLDITMPEMNGFEFLDAYQPLHDARIAHAQVVMLTSSPHPADRARALAYDCVRGYLVKPIDAEAARALAGMVRGR